MTLYNLRGALDDYRITKFTKDLDVESSYLISSVPPFECECPAGTRPTCRHRQMLQDLIPLVDTKYFWNFERHTCVNADGVVCEPSGVAVAIITDIIPNDITPVKVEATSHSDACDKARPAFGTTLPPGVRLPNQKGPWRRI